MGTKQFRFLFAGIIVGLLSALALSSAYASLTLNSSSLTSDTNLNLTGVGSSTLDVGASTLSLQTTNNGPITTGNGLFTIGGELKVQSGQIDPVQCTSPFIIQNVTSTPSDEVIWSPYATSTIVLFRSVNFSTGDTVTFNVIWGANRSTASGSAQHLFSSNQTSNSTTGWDSYASGSFASSTVSTGSFVRVVTATASSTEWTTEICYRENP
jgi:hypothetical protein